MGSAAMFLGVFLSMLVGPLVGHAAAMQSAAEPAALPGVYECQGVGADGKQYRGAVVIEPDGSRFLLQWYISAELTAVGLGIDELRHRTRRQPARFDARTPPCAPARHIPTAHGWPWRSG